MAQLDQNLCRRKKNKKGEKEREEKKEMIDVFKCPPTKPTTPASSPHKTNNNNNNNTNTMSARNALLQPPKKSHLLHHCLSKPRIYIFFTELCGLFWVFSCCPGQSFTEKTGKQEISPPLLLFSYPLYYFLPSLSLLLLSFLSFYYFLPLLFITHFLVSPTRSLSPFNSSFLGSLWKSLSDLMKKMKGVVPVEPSSYALYQDSRAKFKHHSLMQDYEELQKDAEAMKNRLEMMKQKKSILTAEVRFLRRRYKYLIGKQSMNPKPKQDLVQTHNLKVQRNNVSKGKNYSKKESALRYPAPAMDLNQRQRINSAINVTLSTPNSDLNHKARNVNWKDTTLHNSNPVIGLNQKERIQSGKESVKTKNTPVFDLNQVSLEEEEEIQANCEPLRTDEPNKSILRGGIDEQHNDMKLLVCRTIRNGSNRSGKRKITWQDQVALRV